MNLISGEIVELCLEGEVRMARVRVGAAFVRVPISLVEDAAVGDRVLIESGVAIALEHMESTKGQPHVPRHPR
ncbi:MAG: HypC/HybG/HupF family hydrogenase formation chaperone [Bacteroidota bacterium]